MAQIIIDEGTAAATPATGKVSIYAKTDGLVYGKDDAGTETKLSNESGFTLSTPQVLISGTSIDFTGIPSSVKRITIMFDGVSTNGTSNPLIQIGDAGGVETSGYLGACSYSSGDSAYTTGFGIANGSAASALYGAITLSLMNSSANTWACCGSVSLTNFGLHTSGTKSLTATLDRVRITTVNGTDAFDAGSINISYE